MKEARLIIVLLIGFLFACQNENSKLPRKRNKSTSKQSELIQIQRDTINYENNYLEIVSEIINESTERDDKHFFPLICLNQKLVFHGKKKIEKTIPISRMKYILNSGKEYNIQENEILYIGVVEGRSGSLFSIIGDGGCNQCSELYALYTLEGELLYLDYFDTDSIYKQYGNLKDALNSIQSSETNFHNYRNKQILSLL